MSTSLDQLAKDLQHAAGAGGQRLATQAETTARRDLEVGQALSAPGPGLRQLTGASVDAAPQADVGAIASAAARRMADDGAALAIGKKR